MEANRWVLFALVTAFVARYYPTTASQWGMWTEANSIMIRTKRCNGSMYCIKREEASLSCFNACKNIGKQTTHLNGFGSCNNFCYRASHFRTLACPSNMTCQLKQLKTCYNTRTCPDGSWGAWTRMSSSDKCGTEFELLIRTCVPRTVRCQGQSEGGLPRQLTVGSCAFLATASTRKPNTARPKSCNDVDCTNWEKWSSWSICDQLSERKKRNRLCSSFLNNCTSNTRVQTALSQCTTINPNSGSRATSQNTVIVLSVTAAAIIIIAGVIVVAMKYIGSRVKKLPVVVERSLPFPEVSYTHEPSTPPYSLPLDSVITARVVMDGDNIYATVT